MYIGKYSKENSFEPFVYTIHSTMLWSVQFSISFTMLEWAESLEFYYVLLC